VADTARRFGYNGQKTAHLRISQAFSDTEIGVGSNLSRSFLRVGCIKNRS